MSEPRKDFLVFGAPAIGREEIDEVVDCLESGWLGTGSRVARFEEESKHYKRPLILLQVCGLNVPPAQLFEYIRESIRLRELMKFEFTKNISDALSLIARWGESFGFGRENLVYLRVAEILSLPQSALVATSRRAI